MPRPSEASCASSSASSYPSFALRSLSSLALASASSKLKLAGAFLTPNLPGLAPSRDRAGREVTVVRTVRAVELVLLRLLVALGAATAGCVGVNDDDGDSVAVVAAAAGTEEDVSETARELGLDTFCSSAFSEDGVVSTELGGGAPISITTMLGFLLCGNFKSFVQCSGERARLHTLQHRRLLVFPRLSCIAVRRGWYISLEHPC